MPPVLALGTAEPTRGVTGSDTSPVRVGALRAAGDLRPCGAPQGLDLLVTGHGGMASCVTDVPQDQAGPRNDVRRDHFSRRIPSNLYLDISRGSCFLLLSKYVTVKKREAPTPKTTPLLVHRDKAGTQAAKPQQGPSSRGRSTLLCPGGWPSPTPRVCARTPKTGRTQTAFPSPRILVSPCPLLPGSPSPHIPASSSLCVPATPGSWQTLKATGGSEQDARVPAQGGRPGVCFGVPTRAQPSLSCPGARPRATGPAPLAASHPRPCPHFPAAGLPVTRSEGSELQPCDQDPARTEGAGPGPHGSRRHGNSARPCAVTPPQAVPLPLKGMPPGSEAGRNATPRGRPGLGPSLGGRGARNRGREQPQPQGAGSRPGRSCLQRGRGRGHPTLETGRKPGLRGASLHLDFVQRKS